MTGAKMHFEDIQSLEDLAAVSEEVVWQLLQPISKTICQPKGNNKAGFPPRKMGYFGFQAHIREK